MHDKQWSKVKKKINSYTCDSLKGRVEFRLTNYRKTHDQTGRAYITVDKKEVLNMCSLISASATFFKEEEIRDQQNIEYDIDNAKQNIDVQAQAREIIMSEGIFAQYDFFDSVEEYFNLPIEKVLKSDNMVIKILCLIDKRVGKRTLQKMKETIKDEKEIIQYFFKLRCAADENSILGQ